MSKGERIFGIVMISLILILGGLTIWAAKDSFNRDYELYSEWCPKLGSEIVEPIKGYYWTRSCFKENNGIITKYFITDIEGKYYLQERK